MEAKAARAGSCRRSGGFPVSRGTADQEALRRCIEVLGGRRAARAVPRGRAQERPGRRSRCSTGAAYVAAKAGVPDRAGGDRRLRAGDAQGGAASSGPRKVAVVIGEPMRAERRRRAGARGAVIHDLTERLHEELQRLFDLAQVRAGA